MGTLLTRFENDHLSMQFEAVPKHRQVILYLSRPARDQSETFAWIKEWLARKGQAGVAQLQEILAQRYDYERDTYGVYEELSEVILEWRVFNEP